MTHYWGLALVYVVPLVFVMAGLWPQTRMKKPYLLVTLLLLAAAGFDLVFFLISSSLPGITIY